MGPSAIRNVLTSPERDCRRRLSAVADETRPLHHDSPNGAFSDVGCGVLTLLCTCYLSAPLADTGKSVAADKSFQ